MPVSMACDCGKAFRVPDELQGKRIKCPGCSKPLSVPGRAAPEEDADNVIRFRCDCGKLLQAKAAFAGKVVRCGGCGGKQEVPETDQETERPSAKSRIQSEPPRAKRPPVEEPDEDDRPRRRREDEEDENPDRRGARNGIQREQDRPRKTVGRAADEEDRPRRRDEEEEDPPRRRRDEDEEGDRPRKRKKKKIQRSILPFVLVGVFAGLLLLVGGSVAAYLLIRGGPSMAETDFLPPDAHAFVTVRLGELQKFEPMRKSMQGDKNNLDELGKVLGLPPTDVERVDVVFHDITTTEPVMSMIVVTSKPYDRNAVKNTLSNPRTLSHEGKTFFIGGTRRPGQTAPAAPIPGTAMFQSSEEARFMASRTVLVLAKNEADMRRALTSAVRKNPTGPLADAVKQATGPRHLFGAIALPASVQAKAKDQIKMIGPPFNGFVTSLVETTGGTIAMDFGEATQIDLTVKYPDDQKAAAAKSSVDKTLNAAGPLLLAMGNNPVQELLKAVRISQRGPDLLVNLTIPRQTWEKLEKLNAGGGMMPPQQPPIQPPVRRPGRRPGR